MFCRIDHIRIYNKNKATIQDKTNSLERDHFFTFVAMEESNMFSQKDMRSMSHTRVWSISHAVFLYLKDFPHRQIQHVLKKKELEYFLNLKVSR